MTKSKSKFIVAAIVAVAMAIYVPNVSLAQNGDSSQPAARQVPKIKGGMATVIGVDQPGNCLRIRSGPGSAYDVIGCANMGQQLNITGVWTSNDWAQTADNGWVYGQQIQTDLRPPAKVYSKAESYPAIVEDYPVDYDMPLDSYLPDYGYETYWYGGIPLYVYNVGVWRKFHPWWKHRHWDRNQRVWNQTRALRQNVTTGTSRNFRTNRSNITGVNTNRFQRGTANTLRSGTTSNLNTRMRNFSSPNAIRSGTTSTSNRTLRSFSSPNTVRSGRGVNSNQMLRSFSTPNTFRSQSRVTPNTTFRSFSSPNTFRSGSVGARSLNVGGARAFNFQGGGANIRGGQRRR